MRVVVSDIQYDSDGVQGLPPQLQMNIPESILTQEEAEEFVSDEISNITGFCHLGFTCTPELSTLF
jgi:hypothetical protein